MLNFVVTALNQYGIRAKIDDGIAVITMWGTTYELRLTEKC